MYGPPGTGKTLLARACAAQTDATFLKLAGPQLVQMFIGDGAKLVRDCFALAKEKAPSIIFIDELDAVGTKRFDSDKSGDREVQRTMLELLNQLDGFASDDRIKVLAATNRVDVLDPALLRSGRLDRKIEFPLPNEESRAQILRIHSRKMTVDDAVNWPELARSTDEFGGAMLKAVCVEAGMIALRNGHSKISHEHYVDAIAEVQSKKKESYVYNLSAISAFANHEQHLHLRLELYGLLSNIALRLGVACVCNYSWTLERCITVLGGQGSGMSNHGLRMLVPSMTMNTNQSTAYTALAFAAVSVVRFNLPFQSLLLLLLSLSVHLTLALPLLRQTLPPWTLVTNLTSSHPSLSAFPIFHICSVSLSPGLTGLANRAANVLMLVGSEFPSKRSKATALAFQLYKPWLMIPPKPIFCPGSGVAWRGL